MDTISLHLYSPRTPVGERTYVLALARDAREFTTTPAKAINLAPKSFWCWADFPLNPDVESDHPPPPDAAPIRTITLALRSPEERTSGRVLVLHKNRFRAQFEDGKELWDYRNGYAWWTTLPHNKRLP